MSDIENLANLARIKIKEEDKKSLEKEFGSILAYVEQIKSFPLEYKDESPVIGAVKNVMRDDVSVGASELSRDLIIKNAPYTEKNADGEYITVKKIL